MTTRPTDLIVYFLVLSLMLLPAAGCGGDAGTEDGVAESISLDSSPAAAPVASQPTANATPTDDGSGLGLLVEADSLQQRLDDGGLRILDARSAEDYEAGHIPGAVRVDVGAWKNLALSEGGLHDARAWAEKVGELGISRDTPVVVYAQNPTDATRVWWTLRYLGVNDVAVLDGGWKQWQESAGAVSMEPPAVEAVAFEPAFRPEMLAEIGDLKESIAADSVTVVDTRSEGEYTGTGGPGARKGRIPGAKHIEWKELLTESGEFKSPEELREIFESRGVAPDKPAVTYCQTGGRASLDAFALELAGYKNVKNYYCSWGEWSADENAPIEKPEAD